MSDSVRTYLRDQCAPLCPSSWVWITAQRIPETISKTTVILKHSRIEKLDAAPIGHLRHTVTLTVADPRTDVDAAEDGLDAAVTELITALDAHNNISWSTAEKVLLTDSNLAWDITLTTITSRET